MKLALALLLNVVVVASGCSDRSVAPGDAGLDRIVARERSTPTPDRAARERGAPSEKGLVDRASADQSPWPVTPPVPTTDVDILFLIDNSNSMEAMQANLTKQFPKLIEALRSPKLGPVTPFAACSASNPSGCKLPNLRIGVVSSDLGAGTFMFQSCETPGGDGGKLKVGPGKLSPPGCATPKDPWISCTDTATGVVTNVQNAKSTDPVEQVKEAFNCVAYLGTGGCGFEHPLESVRKALSPGTNPGFLRAGSNLVVVLLTNEDDCSASNPALFDPAQQGLTDPLGPLTSFRCTEFGLVCDEPLRPVGDKHNCHPGGSFLFAVSDYVSFLKSLRPTGQIVVAAIAGPVSPVAVVPDNNNPALKASCNSVAGTGVPGLRLKAVTDGLGSHGIFNQGLSGGQTVEVNICSTDYSPALKLIGDRIAQWY